MNSCPQLHLNHCTMHLYKSIHRVLVVTLELSFATLQLSLWDLRLQKAVLAFSEHINDYKYCQCLVDKAESFLTSGELYTYEVIGFQAHSQFFNVAC